jgi:hypothetical protein
MLNKGKQFWGANLAFVAWGLFSYFFSGVLESFLGDFWFCATVGVFFGIFIWWGTACISKEPEDGRAAHGVKAS